MASQLDFWPEDAPGERLTWSLSRDRRLRDCARKYYWHHYGSRGGHTAEPESVARQAYVLRSLRSRYMWVGEVVHEIIELGLTSLKNRERVPVDALVERGTRRMRAQYAESIQGVYWDRPQVAMGLTEHEHREEVSRVEWRAQRDRMEQCVRAFFALPLLETLKALPPWRWLAVEHLQSFELDNATILVKPDLAFRDDQDRVVIADWKTGKWRADDEVLQLAIYALHARRAWGSGGGLTAMVVHLGDDQGAAIDTHTLDDASLKDAEEHIRASLQAMRGLIPEGQVEITRFAQIEDRERCSRCNFRRLCGR
jgi:hypothetical protein